MPKAYDVSNIKPITYGRNRTLSVLSGAMNKMQELQDKRQNLNMKKAELLMEKEKNDAYIKKVNSDVEFQKKSGNLREVEAILAKERLDLMKSEFNLNEKKAMNAMSNAAIELDQKERDAKLQLAEGKRKLMADIIGTDKPGMFTGSYGLEDAKQAADEFYAEMLETPAQSSLMGDRNEESDVLAELDSML